MMSRSIDHTQLCFVLVFRDEKLKGSKGGRVKEEGSALTQASAGKPEAVIQMRPLSVF